MINLSETQLRGIRDWAEAQPHILAVRLYGSRAKGTARPDSDIDLALTVVAKTSRLCDDDGYTAYFFSKDRWQNELSALTGLPVHVERYHAQTHPNVFRFCAELSVPLWQRY